MIKEFVNQNSIDENSLKYDAGSVYEDYGVFLINGEQKGASDTFSVSQPIYDKNGYKMGYLGIGCFKSLDYAHLPHNEDIPVYFWQICNPTKYCESGKHVYTYWQNFGEYEKESE